MRTLDPAPVNAIANDPAVRPWLGGTGETDLSALVSDPANHCLLTDNQDGGYLYLRLQPGLYAVHTLARPSARGRPMLRLMRAGLEHMFAATEAIEVSTFVPDPNEAASKWADLAGFRHSFRREAFFDLNGELVGGSYRTLSYQDWALASKPNQALGETFHTLLHAASPSLATHPEDPAHDAMVGATILGIQHGNAVKAVELFNRWAMVAGYRPARLLSLTPPLIDTGDAVIGFEDGAPKVLAVKA